VDTLLLDQATWDLTLDANGNMARASNPYSIAQDVGSALKLFKGELWYDTTKGVPYFQQILGSQPPVAFLKARFVTAALTVPETVAAAAFIDSITARKVKGQVQVTTNSGITLPVGL
jgi:hypothetical protein